MTRSALSAASRIDLAEPTQTAMLHAAGDRGAAALVLGITPRTLSRRLAECTWQGKRGPETLATWAWRMWPERRNGLAQAHGGAFVPVVEVRTEPGVRVYVLAAHGGVAAGEHVNRVPAVGKVRARVVCQSCKEKR